MLKVRQRRTTLYDITYMWNLKKYLMNKRKRSRFRYREQTSGYQCRGAVLGRGEEGTSFGV